MRPKRQNLEKNSSPAAAALPRAVLELVCGALFLLSAAPGVLRAETVVLHLKNGDRIAGTIVSEDTNRVIITTTWIKDLAVPAGQIERREPVAVEVAQPVRPGPGSVIAGQKPSTPGMLSFSNTPPPLNPAPSAPLVSATRPTMPKPPKRWSGEARIGADFLYGANNQQIYSGRLKLTYQRFFISDPKEFFRSVLDFSADYGWTKPTSTSSNASSVLSANRIEGSDKTEIDIGKRWYVYALGGMGYDEIQRIDLQDEFGPGMGYRISRNTNLVVNAEAGLDYQEEYRSDETTTKDVFYRLAEDITWRIDHHLSLIEKLEYFPRVDSGDYRARLELTLSYALWQNISLNVTALDLYDNRPAQGVPYNELQIRSSLGLKF
jgi:hypothetical protein